MGKMTAWLILGVALAASGAASAYSGSWLVVEDLSTQTCYRMTALPDGQNWQQLGEFNTFREAGMWIWEHRGGVCQKSPVFS